MTSGRKAFIVQMAACVGSLLSCGILLREIKDTIDCVLLSGKVVMRISLECTRDSARV
jgi:hypothetical protein